MATATEMRQRIEAICDTITSPAALAVFDGTTEAIATLPAVLVLTRGRGESIRTNRQRTIAPRAFDVILFIRALAQTEQALWQHVSLMKTYGEPWLDIIPDLFDRHAPELQLQTTKQALSGIVAEGVNVPTDDGVEIRQWGQVAYISITHQFVVANNRA